MTFTHFVCLFVSVQGRGGLEPLPVCIKGGGASLNQLSVRDNTDRQTLTFIPVGQLESLIHLMCVIGRKHKGNLHECRDNMQTAQGGVELNTKPHCY